MTTLKRIVQHGLRGILKGYVRFVPIRKGKVRLIRLLSPLAANGHEPLKTNYDNGIVITVDLTEIIQSWIYYFSYYEKELTAFMHQHLRLGMDFVDVGANIGYYTLMAARRLGPDDRVHAFEPDTRNFKRLQEHIALNRFTNISAVQAAVAETTGTVAFYMSPQSWNWGRGSLRPAQADVQSYVCQSIRLDDYFIGCGHGRMQRVGMIKMDIEGAELLALQGATELLKNRPVLLLEVNDTLTRRFGYSSLHLRCWLQNVGYQCHRLTAQGLVSVSDTELTLNDELICTAR